MKGNRSTDFIAANRAAGYKYTPKDYVWHLAPDGITMQLIPRDLHSVFAQCGGVYRIKEPRELP